MELKFNTMDKIQDTPYFKICEASVSGLTEELLEEELGINKIDMPKNASKTVFPLSRTNGIVRYNKKALCILD
jgi:hypothetical protein